VPDGHHLATAQVLDHRREIVSVGRDGVLPLRLVTLPMPAQVDGHDPVAPGEVRGLRREERVIARPPMYEGEGRLARAPVLVCELDPLMDDRRHAGFSSVYLPAGSTWLSGSSAAPPALLPGCQPGKAAQRPLEHVSAGQGHHQVLGLASHTTPPRGDGKAYTEMFPHHSLNRGEVQVSRLNSPLR
jgi:hypothetical protein